MSSVQDLKSPYIQITKNKAEIVTVDIHKYCQINGLSLQAYNQEGKSENRSKQLACSDGIVKQRIASGGSIERDSFGKPYLINGESHISISHTENLLSMIHHPSTEVSIDIERYDRNIDPVIPRFTSDKELEKMRLLDVKHPAITIWSIKECLFKILGKQAVHFKTNLLIESVKLSEERLVTIARTKHSNIELWYKVNSLIFEPVILSYIDEEPLTEEPLAN